MSCIGKIFDTLLLRQKNIHQLTTLIYFSPLLFIFPHSVIIGLLNTIWSRINQFFVSSSAEVTIITRIGAGTATVHCPNTFRGVKSLLTHYIDVYVTFDGKFI